MLSILSECQVVDLTHDLNEGVPTWTGDCGFRSNVDFDYEEVGCRVMSYSCAAGIGTHMDAPLHFIEGSASVADLPVRNFVAPLCVIRVTIEDDVDYLVSVEGVRAYEEQYGTIPSSSIVIADTGWAQFWDDPDRYRNVDEGGKMHFPGFSVEAIELLLERDIVGIGIDTLSPDGGNTDFPVHHLVLPRSLYIIENVANLDKIPDAGAWMVALPTKVRGGAEAPCRCVALVGGG